MLFDIFMLAVGIAVILAACEIFVNGVEWLGKKLNLGEGAVGSVLAAVGTALPETLLPIIAIVFVGGAAAQEIGIGAILGAPFMLSTAAFFVTGFAVIIFSGRGRRTTTMKVNTTILGRDMRFFLMVYMIAVLVSIFPLIVPNLPWGTIKAGVALFLLGLYGYYLYRTLANDEAGAGGHLNPLYFARHADVPGTFMVVLQVIVALALIILGSRIFVNYMEHVAAAVGVSALVLSLIIAPLATELPEKFNSVLWVRESKDTLALGNISGAMVFQSCIPVAVGLLLTPWQLDKYAVFSVIIALASTLLVYNTMRTRGVLTAHTLAMGGLFYIAYIAFVVLAPGDWTPFGLGAGGGGH
ncbi:MAG: sodium:calcium antiporter [Chloroflexota bacterium]